MKTCIRVSLALLLSVVACGGTGELDSSTLERAANDHPGATAAHGGGVGGGGGGAGQVPPAPTADGPAWFIINASAVVGTALVSLVGAGLAARPIIAATSAFDFLPTSAPATAVVTNNGGETLVLGSIVLGGSDPGSFEIAIANQGFSNCFAGIALGPHGSCFLGVGIVAGAPAPSNALLVLQSNDPVQPETDIQLGLAPWRAGSESTGERLSHVAEDLPRLRRDHRPDESVIRPFELEQLRASAGGEDAIAQQARIRKQDVVGAVIHPDRWQPARIPEQGADQRQLRVRVSGPPASELAQGVDPQHQVVRLDSGCVGIRQGDIEPG